MWVASTPTEYKDDLDLTKTDVGLGNVDNTSDTTKPVSTATQTALNSKAGTAVFTSSTNGLAPLSGGGAANFLRADGSWAQPPGSLAGVSNTATFSYNTTTTEPPTGNQLRLNNTTQPSATRLWVSQTTVDGLDVGAGFARILAGHQIYFQDRDDASKWIKYNVTADGTDDGTYYDFTVAYHSGPGGIPAGQVELQAIAPGTVGVPPGGTTGQAMTKTSSTDYAVAWTSVVANGGGITTIRSMTAAAYAALTPKDATTLYVVT